jgi:hypothetical protein
LLIASVTAATLAGGIAAAQQTPYPQQPQTTRAPITTATVAPRPVRLAPAARETAPAAAELPGGPYAVMDEAPATAAYPAPAPARPTRAQRVAAQEPGAPATRESREGDEQPQPRAPRRGAAQAAPSAMTAVDGRMGRLLHDGMTSLFETCPQMARSTGIQTQKLANGISITYVSDDPVVVERLQKMADAVRLMREASAE